MLYHDKTLNIPNTCLREPRFVVAWNIHASCNLSCTTRGIVTCEIAMHATRIQWPRAREGHA